MIIEWIRILEHVKTGFIIPSCYKLHKVSPKKKSKRTVKKVAKNKSPKAAKPVKKVMMNKSPKAAKPV